MGPGNEANNLGMRVVVAWDMAGVIPLRPMSEGKLGSSKRGRGDSQTELSGLISL